MMVSRPPKPPCWRDFLPEHSKPRSSGRESAALHFTDLSQVPSKAAVSVIAPDPSAAPTDTAQPLAHSSLRHKKHRNRLHRTRSELSLEQGELSDIRLTVSLADTKPREMGLRRSTFDPHVYTDENTRRCERWLEGVRASQPLDDVDFAQGAGVEVEVPDEDEGRADCAPDPRPRSRPKHRARRPARPAPPPDPGRVSRGGAGDRGRPPEPADGDLLALIISNLPQPSGVPPHPSGVSPRLSDIAAGVRTSDAGSDCLSTPYIS